MLPPYIQQSDFAAHMNEVQFTPSPENDDPSKKERIDSSVNNSEVSENDK